MAFPPAPLTSHNSSFHSRRLQELPPIWTKKLDHGIHLRLYKNGDQNYPGKEVTLNKKQFRTFESWLSDLSNSMKLRNGAVWRVYTPTHGTRKADFDDFEDGQTLVVAGQEKFKPLRYDQITPSEKKKSQPFNYDANPVVHNRRLVHSGKIAKIETKSKLIKVWANGGDLRGPRRILLSPRINPYNLQNVVAQVNEIMKEDCLGTVEKLFFLTGIKVSDVDQIQHNGNYVACRKTERFKPANYMESGTKNITTSPRLERKFLAPLGSRSNNSNQSSPEHSNASTQNSVNGYQRRRNQFTREEDQVFPARPVKHTRSSEKNRVVDLDKDQGGVFKAKQVNRNTHGAREIQDTRHTRTEVPVDQRQARPVEEERIPNGRKQAAPRNGYPPRGAGGVEAKTNSKRSPPSGQQQPQQQHGSPPYQQQRSPPQQHQRQKKATPPQRIDDYERERSAAKIQAGYRGFKTRQRLKENKARDPTPPPAAPARRVDSFHDDVRGRDTPPRHLEPRGHSPQQEDTFLGEEERAAAKIQAGYRGFQTRRRLRDTRENKEREQDRPLHQEDTLLGDEERAAAKIQAGFRGHQTRQRLRHEKEEKERDLQRITDEQEKAAIKIQAGYRGHASRRNTAASRGSFVHGNNRQDDDEIDFRQAPPPTSPPQREQREDSYDSLDREIEAATKIQSSYRGYAARKKLPVKREAAK